MSTLLGRVPLLRLSMTNRFSGDAYPREGYVEAVVDTGYDGFLVAPEFVFRSLGFEGAAHLTRNVYTADGRRIGLKSSPVSAALEGVAGRYDGNLESGPGVEEILVGTKLLAAFRLTLDYCSSIFRIDPCR